MQFWQCPCCGRSKTEIARKSPGGVLLCRLEVHHDHLGDRAKKIFDSQCPRPEERAAAIQVLRAKDALIPLVERFERALICLDCNAAEGAAKLELRQEIRGDFSFAPSEIATFVRSVPNNPHSVDISSAKAAWLAAKPDFEDRLDFASRMAKRVAKGKHLCELSASTRKIGPIDERDFVFMRYCEQMPRNVSINFGAQLDWRSTSYDSAGRSPKPKRKSVARSPTEGEFHEIDLANQQRKTWVIAGEHWICPCCNRTKQEICRKANSGKWTASIHRYREFAIEENEESLAWRLPTSQSDIVVGSEFKLLICQDCRHVVSEVVRRKPGLKSYHLPITDIQELISVSANSMHVVDYAQVIEIMISKKALGEAIDDFELHRSDALSLKVDFGLLKEGLGSATDALEVLVYEHAKAHDIEPEIAENYVEWLLSEADRFKKMQE